MFFQPYMEEIKQTCRNIKALPRSSLHDLREDVLISSAASISTVTVMLIHCVCVRARAIIGCALIH